eukprot:11807417-Prorocentrum_lima.AAC.1
MCIRDRHYAAHYRHHHQIDTNPQLEQKYPHAAESIQTAWQQLKQHIPEYNDQPEWPKWLIDPNTHSQQTLQRHINAQHHRDIINNMDVNTQTLLLNTQGPGNGSWLYLQSEDCAEHLSLIHISEPTRLDVI